ncbi:MAG: hypothetical protein ACQER9_01950 [Nanobdellota archaeon]
MGSSTAKEGYFEQTVLALGFKNPFEFLVKFGLPVIGVSIIFFFVTSFVLVNLPFYMPYLILTIGFSSIFLYPILIYEAKKTDINENIHLFITYAGTLSNTGIQRNILFKKLAEKRKMFGEISEIARKVNYFAKAWNLGYATTCRKMAKMIPSHILADFFDRFAIMIDLGQGLDVFISEEQDAVMEEFEINYKKAINGIGMIQDIFVSMTIALGFMMSVGLLLPLIAGVPIAKIVNYSLIGMILIDLMMFGFVKVYIPEDKIILKYKNLSKTMKKIEFHSYYLIPLSAFLILMLIYFNFLPFLMSVALGCTPLMILGLLSQKEESRVFRIDRVFPSFVRALGNVINIKSGAVMSSVRAIQVHDFGEINEMISNLYRRLRTGNDKHHCWDYFARESGSFLINQFTEIFSETVYIGGDAEKIGDVVSNNFLRIISLRRLRLQVSSSMRGSLYGSLVGFSIAAYMAAELTSMLAGLFSKPFSKMSNTNQMSGVLSEIAPTTALDVNKETIILVIGIMVIFHSIISSLVIKIVDGGSVYGMSFDFVLMLWMGAVISFALPMVTKMLMPAMMGGG